MPSQISLLAEKLREQNVPPVPTMGLGEHAAASAVFALSHALDDVAAEVGRDAPTEGRAEPYVDEAMLRREALSEAARVARGDETPQQLVQRAQAFEAFLRGDALAAVTSAHVEGGDLDVLEILLGFIRERTFEDASGLRSLEGGGVQAEAESILVDLTHEQLRMMAHVVGVAAKLVRSAERRRS